MVLCSLATRLNRIVIFVEALSMTTIQEDVRYPRGWLILQIIEVEKKSQRVKQSAFELFPSL